MDKKVFIHGSALVEEPEAIGSGTFVWHFCHIMAGAKVGEGCNLGQNTFVASGAVIGNRVKIQNNVSVYEGVVLEDEVFCGPSVVFTNIKHPRAGTPRRGPAHYEMTRIGTGATLGANATLLPGVCVGRYAMVGAGAVVTHDVSAHHVVAGNPARCIGLVCVCGETLLRLVEESLKPKTRLPCEDCGRVLARAEETWASTGP